MSAPENLATRARLLMFARWAAIGLAALAGLICRVRRRRAAAARRLDGRPRASLVVLSDHDERRREHQAAPRRDPARRDRHAARRRTGRHHHGRARHPPALAERSPTCTRPGAHAPQPRPGRSARPARPAARSARRRPAGRSVRAGVPVVHTGDRARDHHRPMSTRPTTSVRPDSSRRPPAAPSATTTHRRDGPTRPRHGAGPTGSQ